MNKDELVFVKFDEPVDFIPTLQKEFIEVEIDGVRHLASDTTELVQDEKGMYIGICIHKSQAEHLGLKWHRKSQDGWWRCDDSNREQLKESMSRYDWFLLGATMALTYRYDLITNSKLDMELFRYAKQIADGLMDFTEE